MTNRQRVVVVDGLSETAQVLRAVFEPQGHAVERIRDFEFERANPVSDEAAPALAARPTSSVLILHDDGANAENRSSKYGTAPRVIIGKMVASAPPAQANADGRELRLNQPFQFSELIEAVEVLLRQSEQASSAA